MNKVLVTGGAGFIGSHIVDAMHAANYQVEVIDDLSSGFRANIPADVVLHELDIRSAAAQTVLEKLVPDIVVHAAAQISVRLRMDAPVLDTHINVTGFVNLLEALRIQSNSPRVVFISTGGAIYGEQEQFPAAEEHAVRPASIYGLSKYVAEQYLQFFSNVYDVRSSVLRLANVYGPRQSPHGEAGVVAIFCGRLLKGQDVTIFGDGNQTRDYVFVSDVVRAVMSVCEQEIDGTFNIGTGIETSVNELYSAVLQALGTERAAQYAAARVGEQLRSVISPERARQVFAWTPQYSLAEGIAQTVEWFRQ